MNQWYGVALFALEEFGVQVQIFHFQFCFLKEFSAQILLKIDWFCVDLIGVFIIFLTEIMICSFNNNMLEKANGKAFNITASAQLFTT